MLSKIVWRTVLRWISTFPVPLKAIILSRGDTVTILLFRDYQQDSCRRKQYAAVVFRLSDAKN